MEVLTVNKYSKKIFGAKYYLENLVKEVINEVAL